LLENLTPVLTAQLLESGASWEQTWREMHEPIIEQYRGGVPVDPTSEWVPNEFYIVPPRVFVRREEQGGADNQQELARLLEALKTVVQRAQVAERSRTNAAYVTTFQCFLEFCSTARAAERLAWNDWRAYRAEAALARYEGSLWEVFDGLLVFSQASLLWRGVALLLCLRRLPKALQPSSRPAEQQPLTAAQTHF
jgi:hypothetical protein